MTEIFVFGSNLAGRHGKGSALEAVKKHGANYDQGFGFQGNSFAIPTKGYKLEILDPASIKYYVDCFLCAAHSHPELTFNVVAIGCGLAGYKPHDIAPLFRNAPANVKLPKEFLDVLAK